MASGLVDPGTHTNRDMQAEGSEGPIEKDGKMQENNQNLNNESLIGTSMLATPSQAQ